MLVKQHGFQWKHIKRVSYKIKNLDIAETPFDTFFLNIIQQGIQVEENVKKYLHSSSLYLKDQ